MAGDIAVLLGPTLPVAEARTYLDALYLPPAEQGSVFRAVLEHRPAVVAIIDGAFAQRPAVRHKEILWAMANGVEVHGAASMGALRAAELAPYGMIGHGFVYRWYRRTPLADDEEVAVAMAPAELGSAALGEALINMRVTLRRGRTARDRRPRAAHGARSGWPAPRYFLDRSYGAMLADARAALRDPAALAEIDALERWLAEQRGRPQARPTPSALLRHLAGRGREGLPAAASARSSSPRPGRRTWRRRGSGTIISHGRGKSRHPAENATKNGAGRRLESGWKVACHFFTGTKGMTASRSCETLRSGGLTRMDAFPVSRMSSPRPAGRGSARGSWSFRSRRSFPATSARRWCG